jgi:hypothetical protein
LNTKDVKKKIIAEVAAQNLDIPRLSCYNDKVSAGQRRCTGVAQKQQQTKTRRPALAAPQNNIAWRPIPTPRVGKTKRR